MEATVRFMIKLGQTAPATQDVHRLAANHGCSVITYDVDERLLSTILGVPPTWNDAQTAAFEDALRAFIAARPASSPGT